MRKPGGTALSIGDASFVLGPKALAASHLHTAAASLPVSTMTHFSSIIATFGNVGQGSYGAADSYMDALARSRRVTGTASTTLQIPFVIGSGMGASTYDAKTLKEMGAISLHTVAACLKAVVGAKAAVMCTQVPLSWEALVREAKAAALAEVDFGRVQQQVAVQKATVSIDSSSAHAQTLDSSSAFAQALAPRVPTSIFLSSPADA